MFSARKFLTYYIVSIYTLVSVFGKQKYDWRGKMNWTTTIAVIGLNNNIFPLFNVARYTLFAENAFFFK